MAGVVEHFARLRRDHVALHGKPPAMFALTLAQARELASTMWCFPQCKDMTADELERFVIEEVRSGSATLFGIPMRLAKPERLRWHHLAQAWRPVEALMGHSLPG